MFFFFYRIKRHIYFGLSVFRPFADIRFPPDNGSEICYMYNNNSSNLEHTSQTNTYSSSESAWGWRRLTPDPVRAPQTGQHPPAQSRGGGGMKDVYTASRLLSGSASVFSFLTTPYQQKLTDLNSIGAGNICHHLICV